MIEQNVSDQRLADDEIDQLLLQDDIEVEEAEQSENDHLSNSEDQEEEGEE